jgi:flagellar assembly protein FliH
MSSREPVRPWSPPDFDPTQAAAAAVSVLAPGAAALDAPRSATRAAPASDWKPRALEDRRGSAPRPPRGERERAYDEGYAAGQEAGRLEGEARVVPALKALDQLFGHLRESEAEFARERERNLTALALGVARKLMQQEFEVRPELLQSLVSRALELVPPSLPVEIRMNPEDLEAIVPGVERLAVEGRGPAVQWVGDPGLPRGSFLLDSAVRIVDGRVDSALRQLYERLIDE